MLRYMFRADRMHAGRPELKLATALFQNLFPAIDVQTAKLSTCQVSPFSRTCCMLHTQSRPLRGCRRIPQQQRPLEVLCLL